MPQPTVSPVTESIAEPMTKTVDPVKPIKILQRQQPIHRVVLPPERVMMLEDYRKTLAMALDKENQRQKVTSPEHKCSASECQPLRDRKHGSPGYAQQQIECGQVDCELDAKTDCNHSNRTSVLGAGSLPDLKESNQSIGRDLVNRVVIEDVQSDSEVEELSAEEEKAKFDEFLRMLDDLDTAPIFNEIVGDRKTLTFPSTTSLVIYESSSVWDASIPHDHSSWDSYFKSSRYIRSPTHYPL